MKYIGMVFVGMFGLRTFTDDWILILGLQHIDLGRSLDWSFIW
jgi:hypothetical protein